MRAGHVCSECERAGPPASLSSAVRRTRPHMCKRILIFALVVAVVAVVVAVVLLLLPQPEPQVFGTLPREDVVEVTQIVRRRMRRDILPGFSLYSIRQFPASFRRHWSDRILSIHVRTNGTVEVRTGVIHGPLDGIGTDYELRRCPKGWEITGRGFWISAVEPAPSKNMRASTRGPRYLSMRARRAARAHDMPTSSNTHRRRLNC
jgi:hypothetical protein